MAKLKQYFLVCFLVAVIYLVFTSLFASFRLIASSSILSKRRNANLHKDQQHPHHDIINKQLQKRIKPMDKGNGPELTGRHITEQSISEHGNSNNRETELIIAHEPEPLAKHDTFAISDSITDAPKLNKGPTIASGRIGRRLDKLQAQKSKVVNIVAENDTVAEDKRTSDVIPKLTNLQKPLPKHNDLKGAIESNKEPDDLVYTHVAEVDNVPKKDQVVTNILQPTDKLDVPEYKTKYSNNALNVPPDVDAETGAIDHDVNTVSKKIKTKINNDHIGLDLANNGTRPTVPKLDKHVEVWYDNPEDVTDDYQSDVPNLFQDISETLLLMYDEPEFDYGKVTQHQAKHENLFRKFPNYQSESKMLVYRCQAECGGWADRLKGIVQVYMLSILSKRRFAIEMKEPSDINNLLKPNLLNWRLAEVEKEGVTKGKVDNKRLHDTIVAQYERFDYDPVDLFQQDIVYVIANQDWTRSLRKLTITPLRFPEIYKFSSSDLTRIVYHGLFKPSDKLRSLLDEFFRNKTAGKKLACLHARMGKDSEEEYVRYKFNEIMTPLQFLKDHFSEVDYKIVVATDNNEVKNFSRAFFPNFVDTAYSGPIVHIDLVANETTEQDIKDSGFMRSLLDHMILTRCDSLILTSSGFGITAAILRHTSRGLYVFKHERNIGINRIVPVRRETVREMFQYNCPTQIVGASYICDS